MISNLLQDILRIPLYILIVVLVVVAFVIYKKIKVKRIAAEQQRLHEEELIRQKEERRRKAEQEKKRQAEYQAELEKKAKERERKTQQAILANPGSEKYRMDKIQQEATGHLMTITEFTPISKKRFVAFDLETTGLSYGDKIVEIGAVRVENGEITDRYSQLVNPEIRIPEEASMVNHITDDMVSGQPTINELLPAFLNFVGDDVLAAHNAKFDFRFLANACMWNKFRIPENYFDTMNLSRYWPDAENKKLSTLIAAAGIENDEAHRALGDAEAVAKLIVETNKIRKSGSKKNNG